MKIAYVAHHNGQGNDDEGAIAYALEQLGHEVSKVHEAGALMGAEIPEADFILFHKWACAGVHTKASKVFWFFDKVAPSDDDIGTKLEHWTAHRRHWMAKTMADPQLLMGFCTDGDWVSQDKTGKLMWLPQGFDERWAGKGRLQGPAPDVAFFGTATRNGNRRRRCLEALQERYGDRFWCLNKETTPTLHGQALANLCVSAKVIVAPDGPCTNRYWSNRIYLVTGMGGLLVHPHLLEMCEQYRYAELMTYTNEEHMFQCIDSLLRAPALAESMRRVGHERTMAEHTYRHRCKVLVEEVARRLDDAKRDI